MQNTYSTGPTGDATLARQAFDQMRFDILRCQLLPGERLRLENLRTRYSIGFSPLREALMRLESEGLVRLEDKKGFSVASASSDQLEDIARSRSEIESLTLGWSIEKGDVVWEANLLSAFHRLSNFQKTEDGVGGHMSADWAAEHMRFHLALISACGSPTMTKLWKGLFDQFERYVALSIANTARPRDDVREHKQLMNAAMERNISEAQRLCRMHVDRTMNKVLLSGVLDDKDAQNSAQTVKEARERRRRPD
jgi:GntR family carbon starvation induced transcriptional regulator